MIEFKNKSRVEAILENMLGATNNLKPPQSRIEILLIELLHLIEDISHGSGTVFRFLGEKEDVDDLPETGNEQGDVWFVKEKMAGFIWIVREDYPDGYWEELGEVIDTASLENIFFPVQYNLTEYADILDAIQSNKIPILIFYPSAVNTQRRLAYFGYNNDSGVHFYELSSDSEIIEYLINNTSPSWKSPRSITFVNSVNGKTGVVTLTAEDVGAMSETSIVDLGTDFTTIQGLYAAGKALFFNDGGRMGVMYDGESNRFYSFIVSTGAGYQIFKCTNGATPEWTTETIHLPASVNGQTGTVVLDAEDVGAQTPFLTTTLTIAVADWNDGSCTKTVTGMTADALGFVKYSDTETEFTETQGTNSLTFTAATTPSGTVEVYVAWFKEVTSA